MYDIFEYDNEIDTLIESKNLKRLIFIILGVNHS